MVDHPDRLIHADHLCLSAGDSGVRVERLNMDVQRGAFYVILGEKGSGKRTLLRGLAGDLVPLSGKLEWFGSINIHSDYVWKNRIGVMCEPLSFVPNLTVYEHLELHRRMMGVPDKQASHTMLELLSLEKYAHQRAGRIPAEAARGCAIARALLHRPELLLLDEPLSGLAPEVRARTIHILREWCEIYHMTVIMTASQLQDVPACVTTVGLMEKGRLTEELPGTVYHSKIKDHLILRVSDDQRASLLLEQRMGIYHYRVTEPSVILVYEQLDQAGAINRMLITEQIEVYELSYGSGKGGLISHAGGN
ncbi:ATP-binding cassette domain-containing protein [Paenibacillus bovis]|uniref:ABC transporter domain-containing protein n=1 Tax=Paenibacillus bovis TaxID=1616788 RepID=A0A172ZBC4_9BACL|nr:ATP-binding cassette domain-containing protein [Paenibacillus bovis]ANF94945.1 hypothetical protein AR543_02110 [Paenibacillus bovis]